MFRTYRVLQVTPKYYGKSTSIVTHIIMIMFGVFRNQDVQSTECMMYGMQDV